MTVHAPSGCVRTFTGKKFFIFDPRPEDVCAADIAHALSMQCRYNGHTEQFYSVAQHCVLMSHAVSLEYQLEALLHDAAEAYIGDIVRPLKHSSSMTAYCNIDENITSVIYQKYGLPPYQRSHEVKQADSRILADEAHLVRNLAPDISLEPLGVTINRWSPAEAERRYLMRLSGLTGLSVP